MEFKIGCSGFYNKHWKGIFYPQDMPQKNWFGFYSEQLNTLELNVTFYRFPREEVLESWWIKSPDHFKISVKAPRIITHLKKFNDCEQLIGDFYSTCERGLKNKLSGMLFQLPPSIQYSEQKLEQICRSMNPAFTNVIEFRHPSWWDQKVIDVLTDYRIVFCSVSHPTLPEDIVVNRDIAYVRLHGRPDMFYSPYTTLQLQGLKDQILSHGVLKEVYIYFNNTAGEAGILNAMELKRMVEQG